MAGLLVGFFLVLQFASCSALRTPGGVPTALVQHQTSNSLSPQSINTSSPLRNFQLSVPPSIPADAGESCTVQLSRHTFGNSWGQPSVSQYTPPDARACGSIDHWTSVILNYTATSNGTQYDRLSSVYLSKVEILRTSTSEPTTGAGIYWSVLKDVTAYARLFDKAGTVIVDLGNGIDKSKGLDGQFDVSVSLIFYAKKQRTASHDSVELHPDSIVPISNDYDKAVPWFSIEEDGHPGTTLVNIPPNAERAVVEIYASGNAREEFWYTNVPDSLQATMPDMLGKGSFREISLSIDGRTAGYAVPFPVIFSGGIVPSAWRPMIAYGAFDQPTYSIDITPFLPAIAGKTVRFAIAVHGQGDALKRSIYGNWFVSGNVKIWNGEEPTTGDIIEYINPPLQDFAVVHQQGRGRATATTTAHRYLKLVSEVNGRTVVFEQNLHFINEQRLSQAGGTQQVRQLISGNSTSWSNKDVASLDSFSFPLSITSDYSHSHHFGASIQLGYHRKSSDDQTDVVQRASGEIYLNDIGRVVNGTGHSEGHLEYRNAKGRRYEHKVRTEGIDVLLDKERDWRWMVIDESWSRATRDVKTQSIWSSRTPSVVNTENVKD